jgi:hypothetical protein
LPPIDRPIRATVVIVSAATIADALPYVLPDPESSTHPTLIVPEVASQGKRGASPYLVDGLLKHFREHRPTRVGLPACKGSMLEHWERLARRSATPVDHLGRQGWDRLVIDDPHVALSWVDIPVELADAQAVLALIRAERKREPFDFWPTVVHPNTAARARLSDDRDRMVPELCAAKPLSWLIDLTLGGGFSTTSGIAILALTTDVVAAELCALTVQQLSWAFSGYEQAGPWEHPRIQAACDLGVGIAAGFGLAVSARPGDDPAQRLAERIARRLDCTIEIEE